MTTSRRRPEVDDDDLQPVQRASRVERDEEAAPAEVTAETPPEDAPPKKVKKPLYPRLLRLQHIEPNAWQRAALGEGAVGAGVLLSMADLATAWSIVALPVAVAVIVKANDALQGLLDRGASSAEPPASPG